MLHRIGIGRGGVSRGVAVGAPMRRATVGAGLLVLGAAPAAAQTDNVTRCYVRGSIEAVIIQNGQTSVQQCHALAVKCTGNPNVVSSFNATPFIIRQAYRVCGILE